MKTEIDASRGMIRQGDVLLKPIARPRGDIEDVSTRDPRGLVLAEGETSGHHHEVLGKGARLFSMGITPDQLILYASEQGASIEVVNTKPGMPLRHEPVKIEPGFYEVVLQRAFEVPLID